jgi:hypothetical protein
MQGDVSRLVHDGHGGMLGNMDVSSQWCIAASSADRGMKMRMRMRIMMLMLMRIMLMRGIIVMAAAIIAVVVAFAEFRIHSRRRERHISCGGELYST